MARSRRSSASIEDVLRGRAPARIEQLFDWIHDVNPTGQELRPGEEAEAYALKAKLQSLLIEQFGELLRIEVVPGAADDIVGLRHRTYDKNACHARCSALSPAARAFVRRQLDRALDETDGAPPAAAARPPVARDARPEADELALGRRALEDFDFDAAERHFAAALHTADGADAAHRAAKALLELYVDHLADDERALAIQSALGRGWESDAELACLVAIAAARCGERELAQQLARSHDHPRADDVWLAVGQHALEQGELELCARALDRVPANRESAHARQSLADALARRHADLVAPLEQQLADLTPGDDASAAQEIAQRILTLVPDHPAARELLRALRRDAVAARRDATAAELDDALLRGELDRARSCWSRLAELGATPETVQALAIRIDAAARSIAAQADAESAAELAQRLDAPCTAEAVRDWWEASEAVRAGLRSKADLSTRAARAIGWLEDFGPTRAAARCANIARAVEALAAAAAALAVGRVDEASSTLAPHADLLAQATHAPALCAEVEAALHAQRRSLALASLAAAESAMSGEPAEVLDRLAGIDERSLTPEERKRLRQLRDACEAQRDRATSLVAADVAERRGDLLAAYAIVTALLSRVAEGEARASIASRAGALLDAIGAAWIEDRDEGGTIAFDCDLNRPGRLHAVIGDEADPRLLVAETFGGRIFLRSLSPVARERSTAVVLRPTGGFELLGLGVDAGRIALLGRDGVLALDAATFGIVHFEPWPHAIAAAEFHSIALGPDPRFAWLFRRAADGSRDRVRAFDRRGALPPSQELAAEVVEFLPGGARPLVVRSDVRNGFRILDGRGESLFGTAGSTSFHTATRAPDGEGVLVVSGMPGSPLAGGGETVTAQVYDLDGAKDAALELGHCSIPMANGTQATVSMHDRHAFVATHLGEAEAVLIAIASARAGPGERWRVPLPDRHALAHDESGRTPLLQIQTPDGIDLVRLGATVPELGKPTARPEELPDLRLTTPCEWQEGEVARRATIYAGVLRLLDTRCADARITRWLSADPELEDLLALAACRVPRTARRAIVDRVEREHPDAADARLLLADDLVRAGQCRSALGWLERTDPEALGARAAAHHAHLSAACLLAAGRTRDARAAWRAGRRIQCQKATGLGTWLDALLAPPSKHPERLRDPSLAALVGRLRAADLALEHGDGPAALRLLEHPAVWVHRHPQIRARIAAAWLAVHPTSGPRNFRAREVLAELLAAWVAGLVPSADLGELSWSSEQLDELAGRAARWLGEAPTRKPPALSPEPERLYPLPGARLEIAVAASDHSKSRFAAVLDDPHHRTLLEDRHAELRIAIREVRGPRTNRDVAGLVVMREHPDFEVFCAAAEQLLCLPRTEGEIALPFARETAMQVLASWPRVYQAFLQVMSTQIGRASSPAILLTELGAAFGELKG